MKGLTPRRGIDGLSDRYRKRLKEQDGLDEAPETILMKLKQMRQEIASREYPG
jgi:hypothetical protein